MSAAVYKEESKELTLFVVNCNIEEDVELTADLRGMGNCRLLEHIVLECDTAEAGILNQGYTIKRMSVIII